MALVEFWEPEAGDTHELLGSREVLHERQVELSPGDLAQMAAADDRVLQLVGSAGADWDGQMLKQAAELIRAERQRRKQAA